MDENNRSTNSDQPEDTQVSAQSQNSFEFGADTTPNQPPTTMDTSEPVAKKSSKKKWFLVGGIAVIVILIAGLIGAYFWYQSPNKVVSDSVLHLVSLKKATMSGSVSATSKDYKVVASFNGGSNDNRESKANMTLSITAKSGELKGKDFKIEGAFVATKDGTIYLQAKDLQQLVTTYVDTMVQTYVTEGFVEPSQLGELKAQIHAQLDPVVKKIDGQWIKISPSDLTSDDSSDKSTQCVQDTIKALQNDTSVQNDLKNAYKKNQFITIKKELGLKDGSYGYELTYDKAKAKDFGKAVKNTDFGKKLSSCDSTDGMSDDSGTTDDDYTTTFQVWVSQWSHQITRVKAEGQPKNTKTDPVISFDLKLDAGKTTPVQAPSNAKSFKDLESEFKALSPMTSGI